MFYLKVGLRNILKNPRRSLLTMIPIIIGMVACLLTHGFFNWNMNELRESMIRGGIGHYQLYAEGFSRYGADDPFRYLVRDADMVMKELWAIPEAELVTARVAFSGILSSGDRSAIVMGEAGDPELEARLRSYSGLVLGTNLGAGRPNGLVIGDGVFRKMNAKIGDTLTLMGNMKGGGLNAVDLVLAGVTRTGFPDLDNTSASAELENIQYLLGIGRSAQKIVVLLKSTSDTEKVLPKITEIAKKYKLEFKDWQPLAEYYWRIKIMDDVIFTIIITIVLAIVIFTISNTVNMNLYDRIREIGTIRALGTVRGQVALIFIAESFLLGLIGGVTGLTFSWLFAVCNGWLGGIPVNVTEGDHSAVMHVFFRLDIQAVGISLLLFVLVAVAASILPSRKAGRISIVDALRWL